MSELVWKKIDDMTFEHTVLVGEPEYGDLMYAFAKDTTLISPEVIGIDRNKQIIFSDDREIQKAEGAKPVPSLKQFVDELPIFSAGVADYDNSDSNIRFSFGLDERKTLQRKEYVLVAKFVCPEGLPPVNDEAAFDVLDRISSNAATYKMWRR